MMIGKKKYLIISDDEKTKSKIAEVLKDKGIPLENILTASTIRFDVSSKEEVERGLCLLNPDIIIYFADPPKENTKISGRKCHCNSIGPRNLAKSANILGKTVVYICDDSKVETPSYLDSISLGRDEMEICNQGFTLNVPSCQWQDSSVISWFISLAESEDYGTYDKTDKSSKIFQKKEGN